MNNERNNMTNSDERNTSSLSSFPNQNNDRHLEAQGDNLAAAKERSIAQPKTSSLSSGGSDKNMQSSQPQKGGFNSANNSSEQRSLPQKNPALENPGARNHAINRNALGNLAGGKKALQNFAASSALQAAGVPKVASDALVNSKMGQKALAAAQNPAGAALKNIKNLGKSEAEKDEVDKEEEAQEKERTTGSFMLRVPLHIKLIIFLGIIPTFCLILLFIIIIGSIIGDEKTGAMFYGELSGSEKSELNDLRNDMSAEDREDIEDYREELGRGEGNLTYQEFLSRYENLGNIFEYFECENDKECLQRDEVKFYIKINDISLRYRQIHNIRLDWTLLLATALSFDLDVKEMFSAFYHNYKYEDVEKYDILMDLDWNYDYKKIPGYKYLDKNDYRYDLQILAKNMVRKTTTQTCTKCTKNAEGEEVCVVTKTKTDLDIEDQYLKPDQPYYLKCESDETYDIYSSYRYDEEKYKEFLLEYIEHKFYLQGGSNIGVNLDPNGNVIIDYVKGDSLSANMVNLALSQQGVSGRPNKYTYWLGSISGYPDNGYSYPWCATFVSWVIWNTEHEGTQLSSILDYKSASVGNYADHIYKSETLEFKNGPSYGGNYTPKQGDLVFFSWDCDYSGKFPANGMDHIGIVVEEKDGKLITIEGNTSNSVAQRSYDINSCQLAGYGVWY